MSAAAPVVTKQLEPGMECERCASMNFPEQKPAVAIRNGIAVCRRCDNLYRAQEQAQSVPVEMESRSDLAAVPPAEPDPTPAAAVPVTPRILSKQDYLEQFGPANNDDLVKMVWDLKPGQVFILPFTEEETAAHAKRRALKLIAPNCPNSVNKQHRHVVIERGSRGGNSGYLDLPICPPVRPSVQAQRTRNMAPLCCRCVISAPFSYLQCAKSVEWTSSAC